MNYTCLPKSLTEDKAYLDCKPNDRLVYLALCTAPNGNISGCANYSMEDLVLRTGLSERRIRESLENLTEAGLIIRGVGWVIIPALVRSLYNSKQIIGARRIVAHISSAARDAWESLMAQAATDAATEESSAPPAADSAPPKKVEYSPDFEKFWAAYPLRTGKSKAYKVWRELAASERLPAIDEIIHAIERQKSSVRWQAENGRYIPYPERWLSEERWQDEAPGGDAAPKRKLKIRAVIPSVPPIPQEIVESQPVDGELKRGGNGNRHDGLARVGALVRLGEMAGGGDAAQDNATPTYKQPASEEILRKRIEMRKKLGLPIPDWYYDANAKDEDSADDE